MRDRVEKHLLVVEEPATLKTGGFFHHEVTVARVMVQNKFLLDRDWGRRVIYSILV
jgi:hypothetical protein